MDLTRIYGFLAERFMSYWFKKNANYKELPIIFHDISESLKIVIFLSILSNHNFHKI